MKQMILELSSHLRGQFFCNIYLHHTSAEYSVTLHRRPVEKTAMNIYQMVHHIFFVSRTVTWCSEMSRIICINVQHSVFFALLLTINTFTCGIKIPLENVCIVVVYSTFTTYKYNTVQIEESNKMIASWNK